MPAKSKKQQQLFGIARAIQKGEKSAASASPAARRIARELSPGEVKKFARTKTKKLPLYAKENSRAVLLVSALLEDS